MSRALGAPEGCCRNDVLRDSRANFPDEPWKGGYGGEISRFCYYCKPLVMLIQTHSGLTLGQMFAFRIAAVGGSSGQSDWSAEVVRMAAWSHYFTSSRLGSPLRVLCKSGAFSPLVDSGVEDLRYFKSSLSVVRISVVSAVMAVL